MLLFVFFVLFWVANNPEKAERVASWIWNLFRWTRFALVERRGVAASVQATINSTYAGLSKEAPGAITHPVKLRWVRNAEDAQAVLGKTGCIVRIKASGDPARDCTHVALAYVRKALLPDARSFLDTRLRTAMDLCVVKRMLRHASAEGALDFFVARVVEPAVRENQDLQGDYSILGRLEEAGWLSRVLMNEIAGLAKTLTTREFPELDLQQEVRDFTTFVHRIASKTRSEDVELGFTKRWLRVAFLLFAREETVETWGLEAHVRRLGIAFREGAETAYLCGIGPANTARAQAVGRRASKTGGIVILQEHRHSRFHDGFLANAVCIVCRRSVVFPESSIGFDPINAVRQVVESEVPAIVEGKILIEKVVRDEGELTKLAVRSLDTQLDPRAACLGKGGSHLERISRRLGFDRTGERIHVVAWDDDLGSFVRNALCLPPGSITRVQRHARDPRAIIYVKKDMVSRAIGTSGVNSRLAGRLVGLRLEIRESE